MHLGLPHVSLRSTGSAVDGLAQAILDNTRNYAAPLTVKRLCSWYAALSPFRHSGLHKIAVGAWRANPMQVVSGPLGKQKIYYEVPRPEVLDAEMGLFLESWTASQN